MKLFLCLLFTFSVQAFAGDSAYICMVKNPADEAFVETLRIPGYMSRYGILKVSKKYCSNTAIGQFRDVCTFGGTRVLVGKDLKKSALFYMSSRAIELKCEKNGTQGL